MQKANALTALKAARQIAKGTLTPQALLEACLERIAARPEIEAWAALDASQNEQEIARINAIPTDRRGPLFGVPVGIKDIYDTADLPTAYGSPVYKGHRPAWDAAAVARLRAAGAVILGKTVTTEFAYWKAGETRNPHDLSRTPGGSSSGSAAGVADFMVPLATGSQTVASTIRPAAYCGIVGFKPSYGLISLTGVKTLASSLDTAGVFGRSVADVALLAGVMAGRKGWFRNTSAKQPPRLRLAPTADWDQVSPEGVEAVRQAASVCEAGGARVDESPPPSAFADLSRHQNTVLAFEAARDLASEWHHHGSQLSPQISELIEEGLAIGPEDYDAARGARQSCLGNLDALFGDAEVLLAPSTTGEAPLFEDGTGDPLMSRAWTLLGLPSLTLPCGTGPSGLPLGLQLAARPGSDGELLRIGRWIEARLA